SKWNLHGVRRPEPPIQHGSLPSEVIQKHRRFAQRGPPLCSNHRGSAIAVITRNQKVDVRWRGHGIEPTVEVDHIWRLSTQNITYALAHVRVVQRKRGGIVQGE